MFIIFFKRPYLSIYLSIYASIFFIRKAKVCHLFSRYKAIGKGKFNLYNALRLNLIYVVGM